MAVSKQKCLDKILTEYREVLEGRKSAGKKVIFAFLQKIIDRETKEFGVSRII